MRAIEIFQQIMKYKWTLMILDKFHNDSRRLVELRRSVNNLINLDPTIGL